MATRTASQPVIATTRTPYRFGVDQYHQMIDTGILKSGEKVELLEGLVVEKMTQNPPHPAVIGLLNRQLLAHLPTEWITRIQSAITTAESEPEPDVVVVSGPDERYLTAHPGPLDIALVIEVADTSAADDRNDKKRIYARARIAIYWLVNIPEGQIEVYTQPRGGKNPTYRKRRDYRREEMLPLVLMGQEVGSLSVSKVLPVFPLAQ